MMRRHFFAPGVIDGPYRAPRRRLSWHLIDWLASFILKHAYWLLVISVILGSYIGYTVPMP